MKKRTLVIGIIVLIFILIGEVIIFFIPSKSNEDISQKDLPKEEVIDINKIVDDIKNNNLNKELVYESSNIEEVISLVYLNENNYESIIINKKEKKLLEFKDLIKNNDDFNNKEIELLSLKYPKFIVEGIKENKDNLGSKFYYVKDNEVTIYYYNYSLLYDIKDINLTINYNEIKDIINFKTVLYKEYQNEDGYKYDSNKKSIAITFDDGPSIEFNPKINEVLSDNKAHATFFMVGYMMNNCKSCISNTVNHGNIVGSHTFEHMNLTKNDIGTINTSLNKVNNIYKEVVGKNIKYLRPPYGSFNKTNLSNINLSFILWNLDTEDWRYRNKEHVVNYIKENVKDGCIILMHELYQSSYEALEEILPWLYANDYQVVNIEELASLKGTTLNNNTAYYNIK